MQRGQLIAALMAVVVAGALVAVRIGTEPDLPADPATAAGTAAAPAADGAPSTANRDSATPTAETLTPEPPAAPDNLGPARTLRGLDGWLQTDATSFDDFDGQVRIVQFWTFGCYNCRNTIPHLQEIYDRWEPEGLEIIGVHAPEFDREREPDAIASAAVEYGVRWPIALDTNKVNFRAWQPGRRFWPRTFVIDQNGDVRFNHIGEGRYDELEATVIHLLENGP